MKSEFSIQAPPFKFSHGFNFAIGSFPSTFSNIMLSDTEYLPDSRLCHLPFLVPYL